MVELIEQLVAAEKSAHEARERANGLRQQATHAWAEAERLSAIKRDLYDRLCSELRAKAGVPPVEDC